MACHVEGFKEKVYVASNELVQNARLSSFEQYKELHKRSIDDPEGFWKEFAKEFHWQSELNDNILKYNFDIRKGPITMKWFEGLKTNICYNALDRIVYDKKLGKKIAYHWEGNEPGENKTITYEELLTEVCKFSNVLKSKGIKKGDNVALYMPMILELVVGMLAVARIGAIHSIIFAGFSSLAVASRLQDAKCKLLITADGTWRGSKLIKLKELADEALDVCRANGHSLSHCVVVKNLRNCTIKTVNRENGYCNGSNGNIDMVNGHDVNLVNGHSKIVNGETGVTNGDCKIVNGSMVNGEDLSSEETSYEINWNEGFDEWWHDVMASADDWCDPEWMDAEDPLFVIYTSGSTGKPKGLVHTLGGYMLYAAVTFRYVFDIRLDDVLWCTADIGWITGHSYVVYGNLLNATTSILFEGVPFYPDPGRCWAIIDRCKATIFHTAPTAIRTLMKFGDSFVKKYSRKSLRIIGSVGEPINPEAWLWYYKTVGDERCFVIDTYWQSETGAAILSPMPGATPIKPGSATFPMFGILPALLNDEGKEIEGPGEGHFVIKTPWPGFVRTIHGDHDRYEKTYFLQSPGYYCSGDGARRDEDGFYFITGRMDDMLNVSGHLLNTVSIESALVEHKAVAEAAVVGHPHAIKGECLYCFVTLKEGQVFGKNLVKELRDKVRTIIGPFASPEYIQQAPNLPKTRSGKIMRRFLRKIAVDDHELGDISTLADESVVDQLFSLRQEGLACSS